MAMTMLRSTRVTAQVVHSWVNSAGTQHPSPSVHSDRCSSSSTQMRQSTQQAGGLPTEYQNVAVFSQSRVD